MARGMRERNPCSQRLKLKADERDEWEKVKEMERAECSAAESNADSA